MNGNVRPGVPQAGMLSPFMQQGPPQTMGGGHLGLGQQRYPLGMQGGQQARPMQMRPNQAAPAMTASGGPGPAAIAMPHNLVRRVASQPAGPAPPVGMPPPMRTMPHARMIPGPPPSARPPPQLMNSLPQPPSIPAFASQVQHPSPRSPPAPDDSAMLMSYQNNPQFSPFVSSPPPATAPPNPRSAFQLTPAQQYEQMNNSAAPPPFPPFDINQRPPSRPADPATTPAPAPVQRPQSQPQRPRSVPHPVRPPPAQVPARPPPQAQPPPTETPPSNSAVPRPPPLSVVGHGQGVIRLLQFSSVLATEKAQKLQLSWWSDLVKEYFTPNAIMKFTLWKDNQRNEAKPFEIGVPILPRFFLVTTQSGVKSMTLSLDGVRERIYSPGHSMIECINAIWTYKYTNGYTVTLRGPLTAHIVVTAIPPGARAPTPPAAGAPASAQNQQVPNVALKFENFEFNANWHDKYVALDSIQGARGSVGSPAMPGSTPVTTPSVGISVGAGGGGPPVRVQLEDDDKRWEEPRVTIEMASIPGEPVNAFGVPQATMRCLELAESVSAMTDLISFSTEKNLGPMDALTKFAAHLREMQPLAFVSGNGAPPSMMMGGPPSHAFGAGMPMPMQGTGFSATTLYSSAPPSVTNPSHLHAHAHGMGHPLAHGMGGHPHSHPHPHPHPHGMGGHPHTHTHPHATTPTGPTASPNNAPLSAHSSPQKQHKTIPQQQQQQQQQTPGASSSSSSVSGSSSSTVTAGTSSTMTASTGTSVGGVMGVGAASPGGTVGVGTGTGAGAGPGPGPGPGSAGTSTGTGTGGTNTPAMASAPLKRKQGSETASPTGVGEAQQQPKRTRRRRTTAPGVGVGVGVGVGAAGNGAGAAG